MTAIHRRSVSADRPVAAHLESSTFSAAAEAAAGNRTDTDAEVDRQLAVPRSFVTDTSCPFGPLRPPSASGELPVKLPIKGNTGCAPEQEPCVGQASKRKISPHFGGKPKRHRSAEAEELPVHVSPYGLLGGLVGKLQPQLSCETSSACDSISVDLDTQEVADSGQKHQEDVSVASDGARGGAQQNDVEPHVEAISGLEHVQPFASIANVAVDSIAKAASLRKFGMAEPQKSTKHRHTRSVLQPFAPPRRCKASQDKRRHVADCAQDEGSVAPALQKFACLVGPSERSQT